MIRNKSRDLFAAHPQPPPPPPRPLPSPGLGPPPPVFQPFPLSLNWDPTQHWEPPLCTGTPPPPSQPQPPLPRTGSALEGGSGTAGVQGGLFWGVLPPLHGAVPTPGRGIFGGGVHGIVSPSPLPSMAGGANPPHPPNLRDLGGFTELCPPRLGGCDPLPILPVPPPQTTPCGGGGWQNQHSPPQ